MNAYNKMKSVNVLKIQYMVIQNAQQYKTKSVKSVENVN